jgi:hypothetical protein
MPGRPLSPTTLTGFGIGTENPLIFLLAPTIQDELKLDADQKERVHGLALEGARNAIAVRQELFFKGGDVTTLMKTAERLRRESDRLVTKVLKKEQNVRLGQILRRVEGLLATARPEVASQLGLSPKQTRSIQMIVQELFLRQRQMTVTARVAVANGQFPAEHLADQMQLSAVQTRAEAAAMIGRLLNQKQTAAFSEMLGEPFDVGKIEPDLTRLARDLSQVPARPRGKSRAAHKPSGTKKAESTTNPDRSEDPAQPARDSAPKASTP